eukprot:GILJ01020788.1.p1 GENE.GILJ01020788.1~~GILJ01020788.1.p1  ORF type:complete len:217 (+),score=22.95 GILJ01020788.1:129-779(+)
MTIFWSSLTKRLFAMPFHPISQALAFGNGTCLLYSQQLRQLGVNLGAKPIPLSAAPYVIENPDPTEVCAVGDFYAPPVDTEPPAEEPTDPDAIPAEDSDNATTAHAPPPVQPQEQPAQPFRHKMSVTMLSAPPQAQQPTPTTTAVAGLGYGPQAPTFEQQSQPQPGLTRFAQTFNTLNKGRTTWGRPQALQGQASSSATSQPTPLELVTLRRRELN